MTASGDLIDTLSAYVLRLLKEKGPQDTTGLLHLVRRESVVKRDRPRRQDNLRTTQPKNAGITQLRLESVLGHLRVSGRISTGAEGFHYAVRSPRMTAAVADGPSGDATEAYARVTCEDIFGEGEVARAAASLLVAVRKLSRLHAVAYARGTAIVSVEGLRLIEGRIEPTRAVAALVEPHRLVTVRLEREHMSGGISLDPGSTCDLSVVPADCAELPDELGSLLLFRPRLVSPQSMPKPFGGSSSRADRIERSAFENLVGTSVDEQMWSRFSKRLASREPKVGGAFRSILVKHLEPEARRAALRDPNADIALYRWYCGSDERTGTWRRQASALWPLLSGFMPEVVDAVDTGRPLAPALEKRLGIPSARLAELKGLTWQKAGVGMLHDLRRGGSAAMFLRHVPPELSIADVIAEWRKLRLPPLPEYHGDEERRPYGRRALRPHSEALDRTYRLGRLCKESESFRHMVRRDPLAAFRVAESDVLMDGVMRLDDHLLALSPQPADGWYEYPDLSIPLLEETVGPACSFKRLRAQSDRFHRNLSAVDAALLALEPASDRRYRSPPAWRPTKQPWVGKNGSISWLTSFNDLHAEGEEQSHCVSSYYPEVRACRSAIGRVVGSNGGRSTAEFFIDLVNKRLELGQNQGFDNSDPGLECAAAVHEFLLEVEAGTVRPDWKKAGACRRAFEARGLDDERTPLERAAEADPIAYAKALAPILPPSLASLSAESLIAWVRSHASASTGAGTALSQAEPNDGFGPEFAFG